MIRVKKVHFLSMTYRITRGIDMRTKAIRGLVTARDIRIARIVGNKAHLLDKLVRRNMISTMAGSCRLRTTVQYVLNTEIDIVSLSLASNLDTIRETGQGSVRPATSAILRNVLIETVRQVADAVHVAPVKVVRQVVGSQVCVGKRTRVVVEDSVGADLKMENASKECKK
jgi:hypothetical protein